MVESVRWMLGFYRRGGNVDVHRWQEESEFPKFDFWHPDFEACQAAGLRVLRQLIQEGDNRDWIAYGHPDPFEVGAGRYPGGQWIESLIRLAERER